MTEQLKVTVEIGVQVEDANAFHTAMMLEWGGNVEDSYAAVPEAEKEQEGAFLKYQLVFDPDEYSTFFNGFMDPMTDRVEGIEEIDHAVTDVEITNFPNDPVFLKTLTEHTLYCADAARYQHARMEENHTDMAQAIVEIRGDMDVTMDYFSGLKEYVESLKMIPQFYEILARVCKELGMEEDFDEAIQKVNIH